MDQVLYLAVLHLQWTAFEGLRDMNKKVTGKNSKPEYSNFLAYRDLQCQTPF